MPDLRQQLIQRAVVRGADPSKISNVVKKPVAKVSEPKLTPAPPPQKKKKIDPRPVTAYQARKKIKEQTDKLDGVKQTAVPKEPTMTPPKEIGTIGTLVRAGVGLVPALKKVKEEIRERRSTNANNN